MVPTLRGFTGHEHVDDLRLIHMNGRMYDPQLGRFLSVDPVIQFPTDSQSLNPYSYLGNNPLSGRDPSGYCSSATLKGEQLTCTFTPIGSHIAQTAIGTVQKDGSVGNWSGGTMVGGKLLSGNTMLSVKVLDNGAVKSQQQSWDGPGKVASTDRILSPSSRSNTQTDYTVTAEKDTVDTRESLGVMFDHVYGAGGTSYPVPEPDLPLQPDHLAEEVVLGGAVGKAGFGTLGWIGRELGLLRGSGVAARGAVRGADEAFHYTSSRAAASIEQQGLRAGSYATPNGSLSPLQAQLDLALAPNRGVPGSLLRVDLAGMRQAGYEIPGITPVGRSFNMPGGGFEMQFPYPVPSQFISVIRP